MAHRGAVHHQPSVCFEAILPAVCVCSEEFCRLRTHSGDRPRCFTFNGQSFMCKRCRRRKWQVEFARNSSPRRRDALQISFFWFLLSGVVRGTLQMLSGMCVSRERFFVLMGAGRGVGGFVVFVLCEGVGGWIWDFFGRYLKLKSALF